MGNGKRPPCSAKTENHAHRVGTPLHMLLGGVGHLKGKRKNTA